MTWKHILAGACGFALGFWLFTARDIVLLPRYEVLVSDTAARGLASAVVEQKRQDDAISGATSSSLATADSYGRVAFPAVKGRISPLRRLIVCGLRMKAFGAHAPCVYLQQITVDIPGYAEAAREESDLPLKGRGRLLHITMRPPTRQP